jgi:hypothetical protein
MNTRALALTATLKVWIKSTKRAPIPAGAITPAAGENISHTEKVPAKEGLPAHCTRLAGVPFQKVNMHRSPNTDSISGLSPQTRKGYCTSLKSPQEVAKNK